MPEKSSFAPLRHRSFALVWSGSFISNVGTWMQAAALGYYTAHLTKSAGWSAAVAAGEFAPTALLGPIGGAIADRYSRKLIFLIATLTQATFAAVLTWGMVVGHPTAPQLFAYALANGCVFALGFPAFQAILPELVPPEDLSGAIGLSSASWNSGRVIGPVLGVFVYKQWSIAWVFGINAASFFAVVVALIALKLPQRVRGATLPLFRSIAEGFAFVRDEPGLRVSMQGLCLNALFVAPFIGLIPAMVEKVLGGGKGGVGWLIAAQGFGAVVTGLSFGRLTQRFGTRRIFVTALTLGPVALIAYGLSPNVAVAIPALVCTGALYFAALSSISNTANLRAPSAFRGRVLSLNQVVLGSVYAFSLNAEGQLGDHLGLRQVIIGGALISLAVLALVRVFRPGYSAAIEGDVVAVPEVIAVA